MIASLKPECDILHLAFGGLGGHRAVVEELSKSFHRCGFRSGVVYLLPVIDDYYSPKVSALDFEENIQVKRRGDFSSMFGVILAVRNHRPKCVIAHTHRHIPAAWLGLVLSGRRPRLILVEHLSLSLRSPIDEGQSLIGALFSKAVIFLSKDYAKKYRLRPLLRLLRKRTATIPNGIEVSIKVKAEGPPDTTFVIGMASRLIPTKKIANVIEAMAILCAPEHGTNENWLFRIAGSGQDRKRLEELVATRSLTSTVLFDGPIERSGMANWYQSLTCYVHVSDGETMSMSVLEAASHGLPILASDEPSIRQIFVPNNSVILLPSSDPSVIATVLRQLRRSSNLNNVGAAAREVIRNDFDHDKMAIRYLQLLSEIKAISRDATSDAIAKISRGS